MIRKRTISFCQPPDLDSLPEFDRQSEDNEENNVTTEAASVGSGGGGGGGGAGLNEFGEREDELSIS